MRLFTPGIYEFVVSFSREFHILQTWIVLQRQNGLITCGGEVIAQVRVTLLDAGYIAFQFIQRDD